MSRSNRWRGFTLVELLVVIGIIALLISILLPALNRARAHANLIDCQARLRQMGQAMHIYAANNKDLIPWALLNHNAAHLTNVPNPHGENWWKWHYTLSQVMGVDEWWENGAGGQDDTWKRNSPVFIDKDSVEGTPWGWRSDYIVNPRVFAVNETQDLYPTASGGDPKPTDQITQRKIGSFTKASEVMAIWDAPQWSGHGNSSFEHAFYMQGWQWFWGTFYVNPPSPIGWVNGSDYWSKPIWPGQAQGDGKALQKKWNKDFQGFPWAPAVAGEEWGTAFRFRHVGNTTLNALFIDGHVESRKVGEVLLKDVCTNYKN